jgi:type 1 fimbria pilin
MKRILTLAIALTLAITFTYPAYAQTLFEERTVTPIFTGLNYAQTRRVTSNGLLDVHTLTIDVNQQHLELQPVSSRTDNGLKETLTRLLDANGAVAGVNLGGHPFGRAWAGDAKRQNNKR